MPGIHFESSFVYESSVDEYTGLVFVRKHSRGYAAEQNWLSVPLGELAVERNF
jgi:hypothetical protein